MEKNSVNYSRDYFETYTQIFSLIRFSLEFIVFTGWQKNPSQFGGSF